MNKPYAIIFLGFLAILMGIGNNKAELIPSELKLTIGVLLIVYGIYLNYKPSSENKQTETTIKKQDRKGSSYIYLAIGVLLIKSPAFLDPDNSYKLNFIKVLIFIIGFGFVVYGLILFFKEKKEKRESGSIE